VTGLVGRGAPAPLSALELDSVVIGGGVVGLALARALARAGREVTLLEAETRLGQHASSRSSEVIHAGIYYAPDSLKARLCVRGKQLLYRYCVEAGVEHRRLGKLIVATRDEEVPALAGIFEQARTSGVEELSWLDAREIMELEPQVRGVRGLLSRSTGIIDSHGLMQALRRDAEAAGARLVCQSPVLGGRVLGRGIELRVGGPELSLVRCQLVLNAAGLEAQAVARSLSGVPEASIPTRYLAKGHYFMLSGQTPFSHLIYPVPVPGGLGVHVTLDLSGRARFGPDVSWLDEVDYSFDESRAPAFYAAIRRYFPALADGALVPGYAGIRSKLAPPGAPAQDFIVQGPREHGVEGLLNFYGIESPGLTCSLALADHAAELLKTF
jgi:L-2-hydroxyglutarate oxidase LhgO